ncbi:MAG TPA: TIGR03557 family F420-dependent LLM class oxidoreductase [Candidatus Saccharimonadales bacterium]|nr:TIGR03557 family F420-dependent LLM class oxidoreductase [Candidatus Saccharimonadales bacterium]
MTQFGYTLYCEGNAPGHLVAQAVQAEEAGFDFVVISDHYHPWLPEQTHAGFAWSILGAIAQATSRIKLATMVTCPIVRYHPAIVAQMAATIAVLSKGRFTLGLGAGERLNEHVVGKSWPAVHIRHQMLQEAITICKLLWQGGFTSYQGKYFQLEDAQVFDLPEQPIPYFIGAGGKKAATLAADCKGGLCMTEPDASLVGTFTSHQGDPENTWGQIVLSWDQDEAAALQTAYKQFRFAAGGWKVQAELPNPVNFAAATKNVRPKDLVESIPCGPDIAQHVKCIQKFIKSGVKNLAVAYPGTRHEEFMEVWKAEIRPQLS